MVEVGAPRQVQFAEQLRQRVGRSQGINQLRLLPIRQLLLVDALFFFLQFIRLLQQVLLELQAPDVSSERLELLFQFGSIRACWGILLALHG